KALAELRELYEPFVNALATHFLFTLPPFRPEKPPVDNWQTSAWTRRSIGLAGLGAPPQPRAADDHFDSLCYEKGTGPLQPPPEHWVSCCNQRSCPLFVAKPFRF